MEHTNRIRFHDMVNRFETAGFATQVTGVDRWEQLPVAKHKLDAEFAAFATDELCVSGFDVVLRP